MATPVPLINGHRYSFASIEASFSGKLIRGFKSINYKAQLEPGLVHGTTALPIGRTRGKATVTCSFEMYKSEFQDLVVSLGALAAFQAGNNLAPVGFMEAAFDIIVNYAELPTSPVITDTVQAFRISSADDSHSEGSEPIAVKCDGTAMNLLYNGLPFTTGVPVPVV